MAKIDIIEKIANGVTISPFTDKAAVFDTNEIFKRTGASPADVTEIFMDKLSAEAYATGQLTSVYQSGKVSYVGQHISVVDTTNHTVDMYQIQNKDGELKKILAEPLKGHKFNFNDNNLKTILASVITALGGTIEEAK